MDTRRETHDGTKQDDSLDPVKRDDASADPTTETPTASNQADGHAKDEPEPPVATDDTPTSDK